MNEGYRKRFLNLPAWRLTAVWWALCAVAAVATPVYQITDEDGNLVFTDQPPAVDAESAEQLTIRPSIPPNPLPQRQTNPNQPPLR